MAHLGHEPSIFTYFLNIMNYISHHIGSKMQTTDDVQSADYRPGYKMSIKCEPFILLKRRWLCSIDRCTDPLKCTNILIAFHHSKLVRSWGLS